VPPKIAACPFSLPGANLKWSSAPESAMCFFSETLYYYGWWWLCGYLPSISSECDWGHRDLGCFFCCLWVPVWPPSRDSGDSMITFCYGLGPPSLPAPTHPMASSSYLLLSTTIFLMGDTRRYYSSLLVPPRPHSRSRLLVPLPIYALFFLCCFFLSSKGAR
jgi:hypothetical protein